MNTPQFSRFMTKMRGMEDVFTRIPYAVASAGISAFILVFSLLTFLQGLSGYLIPENAPGASLTPLYPLLFSLAVSQNLALFIGTIVAFVVVICLFSSRREYLIIAMLICALSAIFLIISVGLLSFQASQWAEYLFYIAYLALLPLALLSINNLPTGNDLVERVQAPAGRNSVTEITGTNEAQPGYVIPAVPDKEGNETIGDGDSAVRMNTSSRTAHGIESDRVRMSHASNSAVKCPQCGLWSPPGSKVCSYCLSTLNS
ncbi:MAG: hypothetical protein QXP70_01885 [Methanomassiliicoccales archaeon]